LLERIGTMNLVAKGGKVTLAAATKLVIKQNTKLNNSDLSVLPGDNVIYMSVLQ